MKNAIYIVLLVSALCSCSSTKVKHSENQSKSQKTITAPIVEKHFYNKVGEKMDQTEYYIQQSIQDYFIKFCESKVTREDLETALSKIESPIKTLTVKVEFREGLWDSCGENEVQSLIGKYVVLHGIE